MTQHCRIEGPCRLLLNGRIQLCEFVPSFIIWTTSMEIPYNWQKLLFSWGFFKRPLSIIKDQGNRRESRESKGVEAISWLKELDGSRGRDSGDAGRPRRQN